MEIMNPPNGNIKTTERAYIVYILFIMFFCSGLCSLVYQVVWVRLAFAHFGIITPVLSVVISVFMLGLGAGSVIAGRGVDAWTKRLQTSPVRFYAAAECGIAIGAFTVPWLFQFGENALLRLGDAGSAQYLLVSALYLTAAILPWCLLTRIIHDSTSFSSPRRARAPSTSPDLIRIGV